MDLCRRRRMANNVIYLLNFLWIKIGYISESPLDTVMSLKYLGRLLIETGDDWP